MISLWKIASAIVVIHLLIIVECTSQYQSQDFAKRNLDTITKIYSQNIYPVNLGILVNGSASIPPGLFNANAKGRIIPIGNFTGFDDSAEYFFGLAPVPTPPDYGAWSSIKITHFSSACPEVASSVVYFRLTVHHPGAANDGKYITTLKQIAFWRFDQEGAVLEYDAWIPNIRLYAQNSASIHPTDQQIIGGLCGGIQTLCVGKNTQYNSIDACSKFLSSIPIGDLDNIWANSVTCRTIHVLLARINPEVHCPHVGPTGGGKCVDVKYNDVYFDDKALFGEPSGGTFVCPDRPHHY